MWEGVRTSPSVSYSSSTMHPGTQFGDRRFMFPGLLIT